MKLTGFVVLIGLLLVGFVPENQTRTQESLDERRKVITFLCNNADSLPIFILGKEQIGDTVYVNYFDGISQERLRRLIVDNYVKHTLYKKMLRDTMNCTGVGGKHIYTVDADNIYGSRFLQIDSWDKFKTISKVNDVYLVISTPLTIGTDRYYLISLEQSGTLYLERVYIKINEAGCITEIGTSFGIM